ncbi:MAG: hypothetical protein JWN98_940 [Abditibacteriota bacterium]|nr:hypothetical protein [Abditibacteriota bacterium]
MQLDSNTSKYSGRSKASQSLRAIATLACLLGFSADNQAVRGQNAKPLQAVTPQDALFRKAHAILADNCLSCHGEKKQLGGLRLDSPAALQKGGASGPVIVDKDPAKSSLAEVLHYKGEVQMPPKGKLPAADIATIEAWIRAGAPWAATADKGAKAEDDKLDPQVIEFFETKVRPVLANNCYSCHGEGKQMAALRLDTKAGIMKGADSGPIIKDKDPDKSTLIQVVRHTGPIKMPQGKPKLKDEEIAALEEWVRLGAPWPGAQATVVTEGITEEQRKFWSFQAPKKYSPPKVKLGGWVSSPIDNFVLAKLESRQLKPSKPADRRTLIRRATFDLHGLPPTPEEIEAFVNDKSPDAWSKVIDRLLASPRYGERWGRHWLDIARYADTKGYVFVEDRSYPHAYNYRDWVIRAFNEDLPYDQFIMQQLAADRLPLNEDKRPLAGMGFLRVGRRFLNNQNDIIDDRIDTTMRGFQGLTTACARCHDHKFDPISTKDYYALYGIFNNSVEPEPQPISPKEVSEPWMTHNQKVRDTENERNNLIRAQVKLLREKLKKEEALPEDVKVTLGKFRENELPGDAELAKLEPAFEAETPAKIKALKESVETLRKNTPPAPELAMTMADRPEPVKQHVFRRGNPGNQGDEVPRRFHSILYKDEPPVWTNGSGRLELAQTIASKDNPLTARVMVNRIWMHHFGNGIVTTPSDFGTRGEKPTHPELLDYLAHRFMDGNWSLKKMHRLMMMSSTYKQSSDHNPKHFTADPENSLLWRMNRRRLELEALRDSLLAASGKLDGKVGGPAVELWEPPYTTRRTVYGLIERQNLPGIFRTFDFAGPDSHAPQRFRTTVPQQALFLMNNNWVVQQAQLLAERPEVMTRQDEAARIRYLYHLLFARAPGEDEVELGRKFLKAVSKPSAPPIRQQDAWRYGYGAYDDMLKRVTAFTPLAVFKDNGYQGGPEFPDAKIGFARLTATGGHTGNNAQQSVIRRWTAPRDGTVSIRGNANHPAKAGDGVELRIVSSREGSLGVWPIHEAKAETNVEKIAVKQGDTIDFVASCRGDANTDSFTWSMVVKMDDNSAWNSNTHFGGPSEPAQPLRAWPRYIQALLMTNEFYFVD